MSIAFVQGNIADQRVDAVVNPVGAGFLVGFAGVNGALRRRGGEPFARELERLRPGGEAVQVTGGGNLPARLVLHARSPIWRHNARDLGELAMLHRQLVAEADAHGCTSLALPAIGCGAHGFPPELAARAAVPALAQALSEAQLLSTVTFVFQALTIRSEYAAQHDAETLHASNLEALRDEIGRLLAEAHQQQLLPLLADLDEEQLRTIDQRARVLLQEEGRETSLSIAAAYAQASLSILGQAAVPSDGET